MRRLTRLIVAGALISLGSAAGALAAPVAKLSAPEYQQLSAAHSQLKGVKATTFKGLTAAVRVCEQIPQLSPLLNLERSRCIYNVDLARTGFQLESTYLMCSRQSVADQAGCALPSYVAMRVAAVGLLQAQRETNTNVRSRGFDGSCARALGSQPQLVRKAAKVAQDLTGLINAMRKRNAAASQTARTQVITDTTARASDQITSASSLSACPHEIT